MGDKWQWKPDPSFVPTKNKSLGTFLHRLSMAWNPTNQIWFQLAKRTALIIKLNLPKDWILIFFLKKEEKCKFIIKEENFNLRLNSVQQIYKWQPPPQKKRHWKIRDIYVVCRIGYFMICLIDMKNSFFILIWQEKNQMDSGQKYEKNYLLLSNIRMCFIF